MYGFIIIGIGVSFEIIAKTQNINGGIEEIVKGLIATGLFLIAGKEIYNKNKEVK